MTFPASTPSAEGIDARGILSLVDALEAHPAVDPHGIIVQRHGRRVAEGYWAPHSADRRRLVYSLSKSFTSAALALAIGEGRLGLDDLAADHLPAEFEHAAEGTHQIRVRHLGSMSSGWDGEMLEKAAAADPADPVRGLFTFPPEHAPGSWFAYSQPPVLALATILQRSAGAPLTEYLRSRIGEPLGLPPLVWQQYPEGIDLGFSGLHTTLDAIARLGQLHLDDGVWDGRRILPEGWVAEAASVQVENPREGNPDWRQGYGLGFWMARHGFRGDGAYGQFMVILPEHDTVVALFTETEDMQAVLDAVWEHLLPAIDGPVPDAATSDDAGSDAALAERLDALAVPTARERSGGAELAATTATLTRAGGTGQPELAAIALDGDELTITEDGVDLHLPLGRAGWATSDEHPIAVSSAATDDAVVIDLVMLDTPHRLRLEGDLDAGTFRAEWFTTPLGAPRVADRLIAMRRPDDAAAEALAGPDDVGADAGS